MLDYGSGNVHSAVKALEAAGAEVELTRDRVAVQEADGLVVPGVGAFAAVAEALRAIGGDALIDRRLSGGRPVLGICVGMQVLFERGVERGIETDGLGEWPGTVLELDAPVLAVSARTGVPVRDSMAPSQRGARRSRASTTARREGTSIVAFKEVVIAMTAPRVTNHAAPKGK